jgi:6-pyruvoyltetrahydropterin/6-carboxytetrahydropterin synthase
MADGSVEPAHGHDWQIRATFETIELDSCGMVVDFHKAEGALAKVLASLQFGNLNEAPVFSGRNPTAEAVARHVFDELAAGGLPVCRVEVTEAPECIAVYETVRG